MHTYTTHKVSKQTYFSITVNGIKFQYNYAVKNFHIFYIQSPIGK